MKIRQKSIPYEEFLKLPPMRHRAPVKPAPFFRWLLKTLSKGELKKVGFSVTESGPALPGPDEPVLFLMNHSSFIDLKIASVLLYPRPFHIICTLDGFVGKAGLMRAIGCIPTRKFVTDLTLVRDMITARDQGASILMYPEASYSFDGTATSLPESLGKFLKLLKIPVVMIRTHGAFLRDPLYNGLKLRDVKVSAEMKLLFSKEEIEKNSVKELNARLTEAFTFDHFREQQEEGIIVDEAFRAEGLERVLYQCPCCGSEKGMKSEGSRIFCRECGAAWELTEKGFLKQEKDGGRNAVTKKAGLTHIPDWYRFERESVLKEILDGSYRLDIPVRIAALRDEKCLYFIGEGRLQHDFTGFRLTGCNGALDYSVPSKGQYSLYSDYFWYEIGDMVSIGDQNVSYYCFPENGENIAAKTRLATEEIYRLIREGKGGKECSTEK